MGGAGSVAHTGYPNTQDDYEVKASLSFRERLYLNKKLNKKDKKIKRKKCTGHKENKTGYAPTHKPPIQGIQ